MTNTNVQRAWRRSAPLVWALGLGGLALTGCGASVDAAGSAPTTVPLTEDERLATIEGSWLCDVQRFAFDDLAEVDAKLDVRLADDGFDRQDYESFKADLARRADLRRMVVDAFNQACLADG